jgi:RNA polymerase sigma-54 factor
MSVGLQLTQRQTLQHTMTQELRQSLNILQYSSFELTEFLQQQIVENPLLEIIEKKTTTYNMPRDYIKTFATSNIGDKDYDPILNYSNTNVTLENHLMEQIRMVQTITPVQRNILRFLTGQLNRHGFLEIEAEAVAHLLSVRVEDAEQAIFILQSLDPIGVGARNFKESLLLQVKVKSNPHQLAYPLIENHFEDLAAKRYRKLANLLDTTEKDIQDAEDFIKSLNPYPCNEFNHDITQYIAPDVIVENSKGEFIIIINDSIMPEISIHSCYKNGETDKKDNYIKKKLHEATVLLNGIAQRKYTLLKVTQAIIDMQRDFIKHGINHLKPMTLKDISDDLGFHESTISRAIGNKYIQTPHGLFAMKSLFTKGLVRNGGLQAESTTVIKKKIKMIIERENKEKPISDQNIVSLLSQNGIAISRRTVAKYREELGIPGSSKRRRYQSH